MSPSNVRLLVIDPSDADRTRCRSALERGTDWRMHWRMETSLNAGLRALDEDMFDCVMVNLKLPDGDGLSVLPAAQKRIVPPAVVVLTGELDETSGVVAIQAGAQDFVRKHQITQNLPRAVRYALERKRLESKLRQANERLQSLSEHDELSGLLNRRGLDAGMAIERRRAQRDGSNLVGLLIDIDEFKAVNDAEGHAVGDLVIRQVARHILLACRVTDHAARVGGDEFAVVLPDVTIAEARNVAERIRLLVNTRPVNYQGREIASSVSIGVSSLPAADLSAHSLLQHTRFALSQSKRGGRNRVSIGNTRRKSATCPPVPDNSSDTHRQLRRRRLVVKALPVVDLTDGRVVARDYTLTTANRSQVSTDAMFAAALNEDRLVEMDLEYFRVRIAAAENGDLAPCHFSLFPDTILSDRSEELQAPLLQFCKQRTAYISISASMIPSDHFLLAAKIEQLGRAGARLEIIDVGGNRGALDAIVELKPEVVRLSPVMLADLHQPARRRQVRRTVGLLKALGCTVVAEDIESDAQRRTLLELGVRFGTGHVAFFEMSE